MRPRIADQAHLSLRLLAAAPLTALIGWTPVAQAQSTEVEACLVATQQFSRDARDLCDQALKVNGLSDDDRAQALLGRGIANTFAKDYPAAIADFTESIKLADGTATTYLMRGVAYRDLGKDDLAIADFGKTIELRPTMPAAYSDRAELLIKHQDWFNALTDLDQLLKLTPKDPGALFLRGYAHEKLHHPEEASANYTAARALDPRIDDEMRQNGFVPGG